MFDILLQVDSAAIAARNSGQVESVWSLLSKGGPLMIPLGILFALAVFFFIERLLAVKKAAKIDENFMRIIRDHIITGNVAAARMFNGMTIALTQRPWPPRMALQETLPGRRLNNIIYRRV